MKNKARAEAPNELVLNKRMELNDAAVASEAREAIFDCTGGVPNAFTLAELLMAVLVISIIMVALAPVITKRAYDSMSVEITKVKGEEIYTNPGDYIFEVPAGITTLYIQAAAGSGGGSGAASTEERTDYFNYYNVGEGNSYNWTVPKGVNQVTFTITGAGGGGGAGYIKDNPSVYNSPTITNPPVISGNRKYSRSDVTLYNNSCLSDEYTAIRGAYDENDLCIPKNNANFNDWISKIREYTMQDMTVPFLKKIMGNASLTSSEVLFCQSSGGACFWPEGSTNRYASYAGGCPTKNGYPMCHRPLTTTYMAQTLCNAYHAGEENYFSSINSISVGEKSAGYRLMNETEVNLLGKYGQVWAKDAHFCGVPSGFDDCLEYPTCPGAANSECSARNNAYDGGIFRFIYDAYGNGYAYQIIQNSAATAKQAVSVRCVRALNRSTNYSGAGGNSGAQFTKTIDVLPGDILTFTIGKGGAGGKMNSNSGKGSSGNNTQIVHKRSSYTMGTYYVKGAEGGKGATSSSNGSGEGGGGTSTTPSGTCYAYYRKKTTDSFTGGATSCTRFSYGGDSGTNNTGGAGAPSPIDKETKALGGIKYIDTARSATASNTTQEANCAKGENAFYSSDHRCSERDNISSATGTIVFKMDGGGGGGGFVPVWGARLNSTERNANFTGGDGGHGNIAISYKIIVPGTGGGAGARIAGDSNNVSNGVDEVIKYEIQYKVKEGERIRLTVGSGGIGGDDSQDGSDGIATTIYGNYGSFTFLAGEGGKAFTYDAKNTLSDCIERYAKGAGTSSLNNKSLGDILNMGSCFIKPSAGYASRLNASGNIQTTTGGVLFPSSSNYKMSSTKTNNFKGQDGKVAPQISVSTAPWQYGLDGGMGGLGFYGEFRPETASSRACGGGISATYGDYASTSYLCLSGSPNGANGKKTQGDNLVTVSGGAGGGVVEGSSTLGKGGDGSHGYIRIRWDQAENIY